MKKVAVFGKPGGGKSTFSKRLAARTGLPLHPIDLIEWHPSGQRIDAETYTQSHQAVLDTEAWILDGMGDRPSFQKRLAEADTLIYVDMPYWRSYWWVVKRGIKGIFVLPEGWPEGSRVWQGTVNSFKVLRICPQFWNATFWQRIQGMSDRKTVIRLRSPGDMERLLASLPSASDKMSPG